MTSKTFWAIAVTTIFLICVIAFWMNLHAARAEARRVIDENKVKLILLAMHNYHDVSGRLPFDKHVAAEDSVNGFGWPVHLLRFMGQGEMLQEFEVSDGYNSLENLAAANGMRDCTKLHSGRITWVRPNKVPHSLSSIEDGTSNTVCFVQSSKFENDPWTKPVSIKPDEVIAEFKTLKNGESMIFGMYDGSVVRVSNKTDISDIKAMLEPADKKKPKTLKRYAMTTT